MGLESAGEHLAKRYGHMFQTVWAVGLLASGQVRAHAHALASLRGGRLLLCLRPAAGQLGVGVGGAVCGVQGVVERRQGDDGCMCLTEC